MAFHVRSSGGVLVHDCVSGHSLACRKVNAGRHPHVAASVSAVEVDFSSPVVGSGNLRTETIPLAVESLTGPPTADAGGLLLVPPKPSLDLCSGHPLYRVKPNVKFDLVKSLKLS